MVNFNGGYLKAGAASTTFMTGLGAAYVYSGSGTIDNGGVNITVGQSLLAPSGSGLVTGTTVESYSSGFTAPPQVAFVGGGGTGATGYATISQSTGAITGFVVTNPGVGYTSAPTVDLITAGGGTTNVSSTWTPSLVANASGGMVFAGAGSTTLTAASTYTAGTTVTAGTLALATGGTSGTIQGPLNITTGATVNLLHQDALGNGPGTSVTTVSMTGAAMNNATASNNSYLTNYNLSGSTISSSGGGAFNFSTGYGVTTNAGNVSSVISAPVVIRDANNLAFNVAQGSVPGGVDLLVSGAISATGTANGITKGGAGEMAIGAVSDSYTGSTTVAGGSLLLSGGSLLGTSGISVSGGAAFGGVWHVGRRERRQRRHAARRIRLQ